VEKVCPTTRVGKEKVNGVREGGHFRLTTVTVDTGGEGANVVGPDYDVTISEKIRGGKKSHEDGEELALIDEGLLIEPERGHPEEKVVWNDVSAHVMVVGVWDANNETNTLPSEKAVLCVAVEHKLAPWTRAEVPSEGRKAIKEEVKEGSHRGECGCPSRTLGWRLKTSF